jgi:hypothetical protein
VGACPPPLPCPILFLVIFDYWETWLKLVMLEHVKIMRKFVLSKKLRRRLKRGSTATYHLCMKERGKGRKWKTESKMGREKKCTFSQFLTFEIEKKVKRCFIIFFFLFYSYVSGKITEDIPRNTKNYF